MESGDHVSRRGDERQREDRAGDSPVNGESAGSRASIAD
jgi:hypothetical protein